MFGSTNVSLGASKQGLISQIQMNGSVDNGGYDPTGALVSIFGFEARQNINYQASLCNIASSELLVSSGDSVEKLCDGANNHLAGLQDTVAWAQKAGQDILSTPGLSEEAMAKALSAIQETVDFGSQVLSKTVNNVSEAVEAAVETLQEEQASGAAVNRENKNINTNSTVNAVEKTRQEIYDVTAPDMITFDKSDYYDKTAFDNEAAFEIPAYEELISEEKATDVKAVDKAVAEEKAPDLKAVAEVKIPETKAVDKAVAEVAAPKVNAEK